MILPNVSLNICKIQGNYAGICLAIVFIFICNKTFPTELKLANVIPLYKSDDVFLFDNYRPVSLLCVISNVFEKVMYNRLIDFLETLAILINSQFGFRKMHSAHMALMTLMNRLISSLEKDDYILGIFLDFSKACDTVDHVLLLKIAGTLWH